MKESEIADYARRLYAAHGDRAEVEAAQKARTFEDSDDHAQADNWRRIRAAIHQLRT